MFVADRIKKKREELGLTQTELARRSGLTAPGISQYESGIRNPSFDALNKLSSVLGVSTDYLISGSISEENASSEIHALILNRLINEMSIEKRKQMLEFASFITSSKYNNTSMPLLSSSIEYGDYIYKEYGNEKLPVDIYMVANKLGAIIIESDLNGQAEGIFIRSVERPYLLVEKNIKLSQRKRFVIACLLSHLVIPWHVDNIYTIRKNGTSTLHTEVIQEMEAQKFASYFLMPTDEVISSMKFESASLKQIKSIAYNKFDVSLFAYLNQLVEINKDRFTVIQSSNREIVKVFQGNRLLKNVLHDKCIANTFFDKPADYEEFRSGDIPANYWFVNAFPGEMVHEESVYNPDYKSVLTLLDFGSLSKT